MSDPTDLRIQRVKVQAFGPFENLDLEFSDFLNVVMADNGIGKTFLTKLLYVATKALTKAKENKLDKAGLSGTIGKLLMDVYRVDTVGRLSRRRRGLTRTDVEIFFTGSDTTLSFSFGSLSKTRVDVSSFPKVPITRTPVFLPPADLLSLNNDFRELLRTYDLPFDSTWIDTLDLLARPSKKGPRGALANELHSPVTEVLGDADVRSNDDGSFFLHVPSKGNFEAQLLAEGHRKLATVLKLISNGTLTESSYLFWDEPETNLNNRSQQAVAQLLVSLSCHGVQVFATTHSFYLAQAVNLRLKKTKNAGKFINLYLPESQYSVTTSAELSVSESSDFDDVDNIEALNMEVKQAELGLGF